MDRGGNLKSIREHRNKFHCEITQIRQQINEHFDILEKQVIENLKSTKDKAKCQIEMLLSKLSNSGKEVEDLENTVSAMTKSASDLQRFLGTSSAINLSITTYDIFVSVFRFAYQ